MKIKLRGVISDPKIADEIADSIEQCLSTTIKNTICPPVPFEIGKSYLIRTITMCDIGRLKKIVGNFLVFNSASWIADTGRFNECLKNPSSFIEIEPFHRDLILGISSIVDATEWPYELPTIAK